MLYSFESIECKEITNRYITKILTHQYYERRKTVINSLKAYYKL